MLDSIYHILSRLLKSHFCRKNVIIFSLCTQRCNARHDIYRKSINHLWFIDFIAWVISLPDSTSYDKLISNLFKLFFLHVHASLIYCSPSGSTPIPCTGVWVTVACGISTTEESDCEFTTSLTVLSVT